MTPEWPKVRRLLRPDELQTRLNISRSKAYELIAEGHFETLRVGKLLRVTERSVDDFISRQICLFSSEDEESVQGVQ